MNIVSFLRFIFRFQAYSVKVVFTTRLSVDFFSLIITYKTICTRRFMVIHRNYSFSLLLFTYRYTVEQNRLLF